MADQLGIRAYLQEGVSDAIKIQTSGTTRYIHWSVPVGLLLTEKL